VIRQSIQPMSAYPISSKLLLGKVLTNIMRYMCRWHGALTNVISHACRAVRASSVGGRSATQRGASPLASEGAAWPLPAAAKPRGAGDLGRPASCGT
jgi:hypothetical protein